MTRHRGFKNISALRIALLGTRGVPASYGGFETAVEEIGRRLADRGHLVTAYGRDEGDHEDYYLGMRRVTLPAVRKKSLETLSHTGLSVFHAITREKPDVAFVFNAANSPFVPLLRYSGVPVALHMDGLEWRRSKWGRAGREYYRRAELLGVRNADALIADSPGIADYYLDQFDAPTELIKYGAPIIVDSATTGIRDIGLQPNQFHLVVARFEPENHVLEIVNGYCRSNASMPLVVVGSAPYSEAYTAAIQKLATNDTRVRLLGPIYDQQLLDSLYFHALTYLHGHSVGGTNPSLLRAIGAGTAVIAYDVSFNRDVVADSGWFFHDAQEVALAVEEAEGSDDVASLGQSLRTHAEMNYTWEGVTDGYEELSQRLVSGFTVHPSLKRARRKKSGWQPNSDISR